MLYISKEQDVVGHDAGGPVQGSGLTAQQGRGQGDADEGTVGQHRCADKHRLLAGGQPQGFAEAQADCGGDQVEDLQHHIALQHPDHGGPAPVDAGTGQQGAGQGHGHDQVGQELAVAVVQDAQFGHHGTGTDLQKDDQDLLQKNRD